MFSHRQENSNLWEQLRIGVGQIVKLLIRINGTWYLIPSTFFPEANLNHSTGTYSYESSKLTSRRLHDTTALVVIG